MDEAIGQQFHSCPICSAKVEHWERYPHAICNDCYLKASDCQGRKLEFYNLSAGGGFQAIVANTQAEHPSHICYVDGVECWADEARFGGIVIQPHNESTFETD